MVATSMSPPRPTVVLMQIRPKVMTAFSNLNCSSEFVRLVTSVRFLKKLVIPVCAKTGSTNS